MKLGERIVIEVGGGRFGRGRKEGLLCICLILK